MLEIKIGEYSATVSVLKGGFDVKKTAAMISQAYITAVLAMAEKGRNKEVTIKALNGLMDGVDKALCEADLDSSFKRGSGFESMFFGKRGDTNA